MLCYLNTSSLRYTFLVFQQTPYRFTVRQEKREVAVQSRTSSKITGQSLIAENLVIDKSNQTAICHVKESKIAHTSGFIHFLQKCSIVKLEETMLQFSTFFSTAIKTECLPHAPTNIFCSNFAIARHACVCKSNQRSKVAHKQIRLPENTQNTYHYRANFVRKLRYSTGDSYLSLFLLYSE